MSANAAPNYRHIDGENRSPTMTYQPDSPALPQSNAENMLMGVQPLDAVVEAKG